MLYINDQKRPHHKYNDVVDMAIKSGVDPKRAYIYLAAVGVKGVLARVINDSGMHYSQPVKLAMKNDELVVSVDFCTKCKGLIIE